MSMEQLFDERADCGEYTVMRATNQPGNPEYYSWEETRRLSVHTIAHYDQELQVLCVDCVAGSVDFPRQRFLETRKTRENALRRTIQIADEYRVAMLAAIPGPHHRMR